MFKKSICLIVSAIMCVGFCSLTTGCGGDGAVTSPDKKTMPKTEDLDSQEDGGRKARDANGGLE